MQVTYNTDCCGFSVEYHRYNVGIRDEGQWRVGVLDRQYRDRSGPCASRTGCSELPEPEIAGARNRIDRREYCWKK